MNRYVAKSHVFTVIIAVCFFAGVTCCFASDQKLLSDDEILKLVKMYPNWSVKIVKNGDIKILHVLEKHDKNDPPVPTSASPSSFNYTIYTNILKTVSPVLCDTALQGKGFSQVKMVIEDGISNCYSATTKLSDYKLLLDKKITEDDFKQKIAFSFDKE